MTARDRAERRRNAERCRREQQELSEIIAERRAARATEAVARLAAWKRSVQRDTDQRGLSC